MGSGLRADVWKEFLRRFGNIKIREGYGLTEASIGFLNYTDEVGPIGRASFLTKAGNSLSHTHTHTHRQASSHFYSCFYFERFYATNVYPQRTEMLA